MVLRKKGSFEGSNAWVKKQKIKARKGDVKMKEEEKDGVEVFENLYDKLEDQEMIAVDSVTKKKPLIDHSDIEKEV